MKPPRPGLPPVRPPEPPPLQRLVLRVGIVGGARYLSHLETMNAWLRTLRRAEVPLVYSQGFHPHPKVAFSSARPVAEASLGEYMDITLNKRVDPEALLKRLQETVPAGFRVFGVAEVGLKAPSLMSVVDGMEYVVIVDGEPEAWEPAVAGLLVRDEIMVERRTKKKARRRGPPTRTIDIRPNIQTIELEAAGDGQALIRISLTTIERRGAKIREVLAAMGADFTNAQVVRINTRFTSDLDLGSMAQGKAEKFADALAARVMESAQA